MQNNYDKLAWIYDPLSRIVFFKAQVNAQISLLPFILADSKILIVGGGTGWILESIAKIHPAGLSITYIEISKKMVELAQKRNYKCNKVLFVQQAMENYILTEKYDVIITAFFFDNFKEEKAISVFNQLNNGLKNNGIWLFSDFIIDKKNSTKWQNILLKMMYLFFKIATKIEAQDLFPMETIFKKSNYQNIFETYRYGKFIKAVTYKKL